MDVCRGVTKLNLVLFIVVLLQSMWIMYREKTPAMSVQTDAFAPESRSVQSVSESTDGSVPVDFLPVTSTPTTRRQVDIRANLTTTLKSPTKYLMLIMVLSTSSKSGRDARDTIRKTWMQTCHTKEPPCLVKFVIGTFGLPSSTIKDLEGEQEANSDLLLLTNLKDAYNNLTRKVLESFVWADQNVDFSYLLKTDHDSYVFVSELHEIANQYHQEMNRRLYWGSFVIKGQVRRSDAKWAESNWFLSDHYLPYAYGGGYVISADLIHKIALTADYLQLYNNEDVSVGVWLSPYLIQRKNDGRFHTMPSGGKKCGKSDCLVWTSVSLDNMVKIHSDLA